MNIERCNEAFDAIRDFTDKEINSLMHMRENGENPSIVDLKIPVKLYSEAYDKLLGNLKNLDFTVITPYDEDEREEKKEEDSKPMEEERYFQRVTDIEVKKQIKDGYIYVCDKNDFNQGSISSVEVKTIIKDYLSNNKEIEYQSDKNNRKLTCVADNMEFTTLKSILDSLGIQSELGLGNHRIEATYDVETSPIIGIDNIQMLANEIGNDELNNGIRKFMGFFNMQKEAIKKKEDNERES